MTPGAFDLSGKRALVTGSSRGIGLAVAELLRELGAAVIVSSDNAEQSAGAAERLCATSIPCDMAVPEEIESLAAKAGDLDIAVLNAGVAGAPGPLSRFEGADYQRVMRVNLEGPLRLANLLLPGMARRGGGSLVLMSSIAGLRGNGAIGAYALAKAALAQMARNLAVEWGPRNVRVNAVSPGLIRTAMAQDLIDDPKFMTRRLAMTPLRRAGEPREVAGAVAFLASSAGAFVTGHNLVVDGGTLITDGS